MCFKIDYFILILISFIQKGTSDFHSDLRKIVKQYQCDLRCTFKYPEVNSKTLPLFPKCAEICGILIFNSNTDLTETQLKKAFKSMIILNGGIRIENSNLKSLSFFSLDPDYNFFGFDCKISGLIIRNNSMLTDVKMLWNFYYFQEDTNECAITIEDNPKLNVGDLCDYGFLYSNFGIHTSGNLKNCGCNKDQCRVLFDGLNMANKTTTKEISALANLTEIRGDILIENTNFQNLSFLEKLKNIKISDAGLREKIAINIRNNLEMTRLGILLLKKIENVWQGEIYANLENLHPDFCLTLQEFLVFLESKICFVNIHATLCEDIGILPKIKLCLFESMEKLDKNCEIILGDVEIKSGDEGYVKKLSKVSHIFGTLSIRNTSLKNFNFLEQLGYMVHLGTKSLPIVQIVGNSKLIDAYFLSMKHVITKTEFYVLIHNNNKSLTAFGFKLFGYELPFFQNYVGGDWGCPSDKFNALGEEIFKTCKILTSGLKLRSSSEFSIVDSSSNIRTIKGEIEISNSNFESVSFLENLKTIELEDVLSATGISINIHHNPEMRRLGWNSLQKITSNKPVTVNLEQLHPDFCLTMQEVVVFLEASAYFRYLHAKLCDFNQTDVGIKACEFKNLTVLEPGCIYIVGEIIIDSGDEELVGKLDNVTIIIGSLTIRNTLLKNLDFLKNLRKMANFDELIPIIRITNNKDLRNIKLPNIDGTISKGYSRAIIEGTDVFESIQSCMVFQFHTRTNVTYNGGNCRSSNEVSHGSHISYNFIIQLFVIFNFLR